MENLLKSVNRGVSLSAASIAVFTFLIMYLLQIDNWFLLSFAVIFGLGAGVIIGKVTEYFTSHSYKPVRKIAESAQTGSATVIISGFGTGMISTAIPVVVIAVAIILSFLCAIRFDVSGMLGSY